MNKYFASLGLLLGLSILISSCAVKVPLSKNFYNNQNTIGVVYVIDSIGAYREGAQGLLDIALTQGKRFKAPLMAVGKKVNPTGEIKNLYKSIFSSKGKPLKELSFIYNTDQLSKFQKPSSSKKKFHKYDLRFLKDNGIDEVLIVNVRYGLLLSYYGMIETAKMGHCQIRSEIVALNDNSVVFKDMSNAIEKIKGKWKTPPDYENLSNSISAAISKAIKLKKTELEK